MCSYDSFDAQPWFSVQRVVRFYRGAGKQPCNATLLCMLNVVAIMNMQGEWDASRRGLHVFERGPD